MIRYALHPVTPATKVSGMVLENPPFLLMLEHFGIGPAFGEQSVAEVCERYGIRIGLFLTFAALFNGHEMPPADRVVADDVPVIIRFLRSGHTWYREEKLPGIAGLLHRMGELNQSPGMKLAEQFFTDYSREMTEHFRFEDETVFPYMSSLCGMGSEKAAGPFRVTDYREHHDDIEEKLSDLVSLLVKYLPGEADRSIRRELLLSLFGLEHDLHIHSRIEDQILIPLVEQMESRLLTGP